MFCAKCWSLVGAHDRACMACGADLTAPGSVRMTDPRRYASPGDRPEVDLSCGEDAVSGNQDTPQTQDAAAHPDEASPGEQVPVAQQPPASVPRFLTPEETATIARMKAESAESESAGKTVTADDQDSAVATQEAGKEEPAGEVKTEGVAEKPEPVGEQAGAKSQDISQEQAATEGSAVGESEEKAPQEASELPGEVEVHEPEQKSDSKQRDSAVEITAKTEADSQQDGKPAKQAKDEPHDDGADEPTVVVASGPDEPRLPVGKPAETKEPEAEPRGQDSKAGQQDAEPTKIAPVPAGQRQQSQSSDRSGDKSNQKRAKPVTQVGPVVPVPGAQPAPGAPAVPGAASISQRVPAPQASAVPPSATPQSVTPPSPAQPGPVPPKPATAPQPAPSQPVPQVPAFQNAAVKPGKPEAEQLSGAPNTPVDQQRPVTPVAPQASQPASGDQAPQSQAPRSPAIPAPSQAAAEPSAEVGTSAGAAKGPGWWGSVKMHVSELGAKAAALNAPAVEDGEETSESFNFWNEVGVYEPSSEETIAKEYDPRRRKAFYWLCGCIVFVVLVIFLSTLNLFSSERKHHASATSTSAAEIPPDPQTSAEQTHEQPTATEKSTTGRSASPSSSSSPSARKTPKAMVPGTKQCADGVWSGPNTSCNLAAAAAQQVDHSITKPVEISAFSSTTNRNYRLQCTPGEGITCEGLDGVSGVIIYIAAP